MAAAASAHDPIVKSHNRRRSRKKASDPFLEISDDALLNLPEQPLPSNDMNENGRRRLQSLLADVRLRYASSACLELVLTSP